MADNRSRVRRLHRDLGPAAPGAGEPCPLCGGSGVREPAREAAVAESAMAELRAYLDQLADNRRRTEPEALRGPHVLPPDDNGNGGAPRDR
jgi:hypothetical protein